MLFNEHYRLKGEHSFLSASQSSWVNYDEDKLRARYKTAQAASVGTRLHELAAELIKLRVKLPRTKATLNAFVNDAIGYKMVPEQILYYSINAFGTADAISFNEKTNLLRIHDLKTGEGKAPFRQLEVYTAYFCLEYGHSPYDLTSELRIYQNDEVREHFPDPNDILSIMSKIKRFDEIIEEEKKRELLS